jgi:hypothetical protein
MRSGSELRRRKNLPLADRFWFSVQKSEGCWRWTGSGNGHGYGQITDAGKMMATHRLSWEMHNGPIADGLCVLHHCDNPACVRPDHLFLGTRKDNAIDMVGKGRQLRGQANAMSKLEAGDIPLIRRAVAIGFRQKDVAAAYGVDHRTVSQIARGIRWRHIA